MKRVEFDKKTRAEALVSERLLYEPLTGNLSWKDTGATAGGFTTEGYRRVKVGGVTFQAHRVAWFLHTGQWPSMAIDHINGIRSDNRFENLRLATITENGRNRAIGQNSNSGVVGVCWSRRHKAWRSYIKTDIGNRHLGYFKNIDDATRSRKLAELENGYSPYHGRAGQ